MSVISMIRVGRVEERELWILTLVLADFVLKLRGICGPRNKEGGSVNDSYSINLVNLLVNAYDNNQIAHILSRGVGE